jgi:hypothetical protein
VAAVGYREPPRSGTSLNDRLRFALLGLALSARAFQAAAANRYLAAPCGSVAKASTLTGSIWRGCGL